MPYGVKRGVKAAGDYGIGDIFGLALAGSAGILAALVTDYQQQGESSALFTINQWVVSASKLLNVGTDVPLWTVVLGLITAGAASTFYFQPITRQGAFAQGFSLLAVLMTAVPTDLAGGLESIRPGEMQGLEPISLQEANSGGRITNAAYSINEGQIYQVQDVQQGAKYEVHLTIDFSNGFPEDIESMIHRGNLRGRLHNEQTSETFSLFRSAGASLQRRGNALVIRAGVPARADTARLWVRIESVGYEIEQQSALASLGQPLEWQVTLRPSTTPLFIQRFGESYWF